MLTSQVRSTGLWYLPAAALALAAMGVFSPTPAQAHFYLLQPSAYSVQDSLGSPQKSAPCGQADTGQPVMTTGVITTYQQGQMITIKINEKIDHPGHYRVSIAPNQAGLPADPVVTAGATPCGSTPIDPNPTLPVVKDGLFDHMNPFGGVDQTAQVQLPPNLTCTNCTLQVSEFMSNHGINAQGGCFYHHCAQITIVPLPDAGTSSDAGGVDAATSTDSSTGGADATTPVPPGPGGSSGCGCHLTGAQPPAMAYAGGLLALGFLVSRRRRAARRPRA